MRRTAFVLPLLLACCATAAIEITPIHAQSPAKSSRSSDPQLEYELLYAAADGDTKGVERALARGANIEARDGQYGFTPLMWASWKANLGTMRRLIEKGANVNAKTSSASQMLVLREPREIFKERYQESATTMATNVLTLAYSAQSPNITPLLLAAAGDSYLAAEQLLKNGADPNIYSASGHTPLDAAAANGNLRAVRLLLDKKAAVESPKMLAAIPLVSAVMNGHPAVVRELLHRGADPSITWGGMTLVQLAQRFRHPEIAAMLARAPKRKAISVQNADKKQATPLARNQVRIHHANGAIEVVR